ncbi:MAG: PAS domain S-box protein [Nitrospinae bacterium]|nr:PAS domain S-box protein [Nitrospinota bacterium]
MNIKKYINPIIEIIRKKSIRRSLVSTMVIVGLLPLVLGIFLISIGSTKIIRNSIGSNFKEIAKETADKVNIILHREIDEFHNLAFSPDIRDAVKRSNMESSGQGVKDSGGQVKTYSNPSLDNQASEHLKELKNHNKEKYIVLYVTDKNGMPVAASDTENQNTLMFQKSDEEIVKDILSGKSNKVYLSDVYFDDKDGKPLITIVIPVIEDGNTTGIIKAILKIETLYKIISDVQIDKTGHANLVDSEGSIIMCPIFPPRSHTIDRDLMNLIISSEPGWAIAKDDAHGGMDSIIGFAPVKLTYDFDLSFGKKKWFIFVRQHPDETYSPINRLLLLVLLSGVVMVAILSTLGIYAANKIGKPILLLKEGAELIGKGDFEHRLSIDTGDEISSLAIEFNKMAGRLTGLYSELSEEKNKMESILLGVWDGIIVADDENKVIIVNPAAEKILGVNKKHIIEKSIFPCHGRPERVGELIKQPDKMPWFTTSTLGEKTVEIVATSIKAGEKTIGSVMIVRDVTVKKKMEKELKEYSEHLEKMIEERTKEIKETKDYLQSLLENANDVIYTVNRDGTFTYLNQKIEDWGYKKDELIGQSIFSILTAQHKGKRFNKSIKDGIKQIYEVEIFNKNGKVRSVVISSSPLRDKNGEIIGLLGIARDITERKRIQHQMNRTEKLAAIGQLSTGIAHEINNPLGGMQNCVRTLNTEGDDEDVRKRYLPLLEKGLNRIESVIRNLLDFAKEHQFEFSSHNLDEIITETLKLVEYKIRERNLKLNLDLNTDSKKFTLDYNHLQQVFLNVIINAIQAMTDSEGILSIKSIEEMDELIVSISDTGIGITQENLSRIFDPFFTTKDVGTGTGLGLSVSYGIIERLGGRIEVNSKVNRGTTFTITIPKIKTPAAG